MPAAVTLVRRRAVEPVRWLLAALVAGLLYLPTSSAMSAPRLNVLVSGDEAHYQSVLDGVERRLLETRPDLDYRILRAGGNAGHAARLAREIDDGSDAINLCLGALTCTALNRQDAQSPTVASMVLSNSLSDGNPHTTGVYLDYHPATQMRWLRQLFPEYRRVGMLYSDQTSDSSVRAATRAAAEQGLSLVAVHIDSPREIAPGLKHLLKNVDILWAVPDSMVFSPTSAREVLLSAFRSRIPVIGTSINWVRSGALFALERNYEDIGAQSADMALQVMQGTSPRDIPPAEPRDVGYSLNLRTAQHMHASVSDPVSSQAHQVFR